MLQIGSNLDEIRVGDVITLNDRMCGYYQVRVAGVEHTVVAGIDIYEARVDLDAWRYAPDDEWVDYPTHNYTVLRWDSRFTIEPRKEGK